MKKLLGILVLGLLWCNTASAGKWGEGELQLTKGVAGYFIQYIRGKQSKLPSDFYVTLDGTDAMYWFCDFGMCAEGDAASDIRACERGTKKKCKKFAIRRTVKWKNGINPGKGKASIFKSKSSDAEIYAKLTKLGFYKNDFSKANKPKITKKETKNIAAELEKLNKLYKSGALTKEEFEKAKKTILSE